VAKDRISKVTTRTGDGGQTKLATGKTVSKKQPIIRAIGSVDELNSHIGLTLTVLLANQNSIPNNVELTALQATFTGIQQALFDTGAVLAMEGDFTPPDCAVIEASTCRNRSVGISKRGSGINRRLQTLCPLPESTQ